jgi:chorismate mutase
MTAITQTPSAAGTPQAESAEQAAETVDTLRHQIDALDTAIVQLITERVQLSRRVQAARLKAGGTRVVLSRERAVHEHYRTALGGFGSAVAEAVLRVCRGNR